MRVRASAVIVVVGLSACGAAPAPVATSHEPEAPTPASARFAGHGPLVLRSIAATDAIARAGTQPPFYAELAADGSITGTRCGATRLTDEGALEREGVVVARASDDAVVLADGTDLGWRIADATLTTRGEQRFTLAGGTISPSNARLPAVAVDPPDADAALALVLFATLLVCDDVGP